MKFCEEVYMEQLMFCEYNYFDENFFLAKFVLMLKQQLKCWH